MRMRIAYNQFPDPIMCGLKRTPFLAVVGLLIFLPHLALPAVNYKMTVIIL